MGLFLPPFLVSISELEFQYEVNAA